MQAQDRREAHEAAEVIVASHPLVVIPGVCSSDFGLFGLVNNIGLLFLSFFLSVSLLYVCVCVCFFPSASLLPSLCLSLSWPCRRMQSRALSTGIEGRVRCKKIPVRIGWRPATSNYLG